LRRLLAAAMLAASLSAAGQISLGLKRPRAYVASLVEPKRIAAGREQPVEMLFRVENGFHINSHLPRSAMLMATYLTLEPAAGLTVGKVHYPQGHLYSFRFDPKEKLDVFTGTLAIVVPLRAARPGSYMLRGELHYQACDDASCYPPVTLPVAMEITAR
jgi:hypothetical protein